MTDAGAATAPAKKRSAGQPATVAAATSAPGEPKGPHLYKRFFDTLYKPLSDLAKELDVAEDYILGQSAHESSYLDNHNFPLNNPFGFTNAGKANLSFASIADAIAAYKKRYGPQIRGATSAKDFVERIQGRLNGQPVPGWHIYNTATKGYGSLVLGLIRSIPSHKAEWLKDRESAR